MVRVLYFLDVALLILLHEAGHGVEAQRHRGDDDEPDADGGHHLAREKKNKINKMELNRIKSAKIS